MLLFVENSIVVSFNMYSDLYFWNVTSWIVIFLIYLFLLIIY